MSRITDTFEKLKVKNEKALVGFVTAGDPDIKRSMEIITKMCDAGMDILELGVPFSDPTADGPVIQRSSARAIDQGVTLKDVIAMTKKIRANTDIPIILFSYYNPIHAYGLKTFYDDATRAGADGILIVDLPPEESDEMTSQWPGDELSLIRLVAPTTPAERMKKIANGASGFLYMVSKTGVTGSDGLDNSEISSTYSHLSAASDLPICVGFGISTPEQVAAVANIADGVVIGSAFERTIEDNIDKADLADLLYEQVKACKAATIING
ncbi:MAG: tryptophan synthase subunit alpha [Desulfobacterales bacterium]|nr:tryptophan synthase subunit alpha [Desulfobacterales bacterium]